MVLCQSVSILNQSIGFDTFAHLCQSMDNQNRPMKSYLHLLLLLSLPVWVSASGCSLMRFGSESADALIRAGQNAHKDGDLVKANELFGAAVQLNQFDAQSRAEYAQSLWETGNRAEAISQMQSSVKLTQTDASMWRTLSRMHLDSGDIQSALSAIDIAIKVEPDAMESFDMRAQIHNRAGNHADALADYERVLADGQQDAEVSMAIAHLYLRMGHPKRSLAVLAPIRDQYAEDHVPIQILDIESLAYRRLHRYTAEAETLRSAIVQHPDNIDLKLRLAQAYADDGDSTMARQQLADVLRIDPQNQQAHSMIGNK